MDKLKAFALLQQAQNNRARIRQVAQVYVPPPPPVRSSGLKGGSPVNVTYAPSRGVTQTLKRVAPIYTPPPPPTMNERVAANIGGLKPRAQLAPLVSLDAARRLKESTSFSPATMLPPVDFVPLGFQETQPEDEPWTLYELPDGTDVAMPSSYIPPADWQASAELTDPDAIARAQNSPIGWDNVSPEIQSLVQVPGDEPSLSQVGNPDQPMWIGDDIARMEDERQRQDAASSQAITTAFKDRARQATPVTIASDFAREQEQVENQRQAGQRVANYARFKRATQNPTGTPLGIDPAQQVTEPSLPVEEPQAPRDWVIVKSERDGTIRAVPLEDYENPEFTNYYGPVQQVGGPVTEEQATTINTNPDLTEPEPSTGMETGDTGQVSTRSPYQDEVDNTWGDTWANIGEWAAEDIAPIFRQLIKEVEENQQNGSTTPYDISSTGKEAIKAALQIPNAIPIPDGLKDKAGQLILGSMIGAKQLLKDAEEGEFGDLAQTTVETARGVLESNVPGTDMTVKDVLLTAMMKPGQYTQEQMVEAWYHTTTGTDNRDGDSTKWLGILSSTIGSGVASVTTFPDWLETNQQAAVTAYEQGVDTNGDGTVDVTGYQAVLWSYQQEASAWDYFFFETVTDPYNWLMASGAIGKVIRTGGSVLRGSTIPGAGPAGTVVETAGRVIQAGSRIGEGVGSLGLDFAAEAILRRNAANVIPSSRAQKSTDILEGADTASQGISDRGLLRKADPTNVEDVVRAEDGSITGLKMGDGRELTITPEQGADLKRQLEVTGDSPAATQDLFRNLKARGVEVDNLPPRYLRPVDDILKENPARVADINRIITDPNYVTDARQHVISMNVTYGPGSSVPDAAIDTSRYTATGFRKPFEDAGIALPPYVPSTPRQSEWHQAAETIMHSEWGSPENKAARAKLYQTVGTEHGMRDKAGLGDAAAVQAERYADLVSEHLRWNPDAMNDASFRRAYEQAQAIRQSLADRGMRPRNSYTRRASRNTGTKTRGVDTSGPGAADSAAGGGAPSRSTGTSTGESAPVTGGARNIPIQRGLSVLDEIDGYPVVARRVVSGVTEEAVQVSENVRVVVRPIEAEFEARATNTATKEMGDWLQAPTKPEALNLAIEDARAKGWMDEVAPATDASPVAKPAQSTAIPADADVVWTETPNRIIDGFPARTDKAYGKERTVVALGRLRTGGAWEVVIHPADGGGFRARVQTKQKNARPWVEGATEADALQNAIADGAASIPDELVWVQATPPSTVPDASAAGTNTASVGDLIDAITGRSAAPPTTPDVPPIDLPESPAIGTGVIADPDTLGSARRLYRWTDDDHTEAVDVLGRIMADTPATPIAAADLNTPGGRGLLNDVNHLIDKRKARERQLEIASSPTATPKQRSQANITATRLGREMDSLSERIGLIDGRTRQRIRQTGEVVPAPKTPQARAYRKNVKSLTQLQQGTRSDWRRLGRGQSAVVDEGGMAYLSTPFGDAPLAPDELAELTKYSFANGDTSLDRWIKHMNTMAADPNLTPQDIIEKARLRTLEELQVSTNPSLNRDLYSRLPKMKRAELETIIRERVDDVPADLADRTRAEMIDIIKGSVKEKRTGIVSKAWSKYTEYLRNQILGSWINIPRYLSNTTFGNTANLWLGGYGLDSWRLFNPKQIYRNSQDDLRRALTASGADSFAHLPEVTGMDRIANTYGTSRAPEIRKQIRTDAPVDTNTSIEAWADRHGLPRPAKEALRAVTGDSRGLRVAVGMDMQMRDVVYRSSFNKDIRPALRDFRDAATTRLTDTGLTKQQADEVVGRFMKLHRDGFSASDVQDFFHDYLPDGLSDRLSRDWQASVNRVDKMARTEMRRVTFAGRETVLDKLARPFFMFSYFMSRQYGFLLKQGLRHPGLINAYFNYQEFIDDYMEENPDLPTWMKGMLRVAQGPEGWAMMLNPMALWQIGSLFSNGLDREDLNELQKFFLDNDWLFIHPGITNALNLFGFLGDSRSFDPLNMRQWGAYAALGENWLRYKGYLGDDEGIVGNKVDDFGNMVRDWVSDKTDFLPGAEHIEFVESVGKDEQEVRAIAWDLAIQQGMDPENNIEDRQWLDEQMMDPTSEMYKDAFGQWLQGETATLGVKLLPLANSFQPIGRLQDSTGKDLMETVTRADGLSEFKQFVRTNDPDARNLDLAADRYFALEEEHPYANNDIYSDIAYGTPDHSVYLDGVLYSPDEILKMSPEERTALARAWLADEGVLDYWQAYQTAEDEFLADPENRAYAQNKQWQTAVYDYDGGAEAYWEEVIKHNDNARRYYEGLDPNLTPEERERALTNRQAFMAVAGMQRNVYEPKPLDTNYWDPVDIANKAPQATEYVPYVSEYEEETRKQVEKYEAEMTRADPVVQRIMSDWGFPPDTNFNDVYYKTRFDIMDEYERRTGDKLPYEDGDNYWAAQQYWQWADVQPVGADTSLEAYFEAQDEEWEAQMPANFNSEYENERDDIESYDWYSDYRTLDPGYRWEDQED